MKTKLEIAPADYKKLSDEELVYRYTHRHEKIAISYLFDRYAHLVLGICMKHFGDTELAKTATNDIFIKLVDDLKRYNIGQFKPWLFHYVKNYSILQANETISVTNNATVAGVDITHDSKAEINTEKTTLMLEDGINALDKEERECIELFYLKNLNYEQIAGRTGRQLLQVKRILRNAIDHLKLNVQLYKRA